ncbi:MAG: Gfo/Idh/MocA family protein [Armatimonadota bacterium]
MPRDYRVAFIGTGLHRRTGGATGFGMAYDHARGYQGAGGCELVAAADIKRRNVEVFAQEFGVGNTYLDYKEMLRREKPDVVSICTWPHLHADMVLACARAKVRAVHCEKPMAPTWGESLKMAAACQRNRVQLTFNHQRRFLEPFQRAKELAHDGTIGELVRLEGACSNMIDWGTHWLDMFFFYNNENPPQWVIGQIDSREYRTIFGLPVENQAICHFMFENGVRAVLFTGYGSNIGCENRLMGTHGTIEVCNDQPHVRYRGKGSVGWREIRTHEGLHGGEAITRGIIDLLDALRKRREPELSARRALHATEVIFATYESSRRRARIDLPLKPKDSAFLSMLESGDLKPKGMPRS